MGMKTLREAQLKRKREVAIKAKNDLEEVKNRPDLPLDRYLDCLMDIYDTDVTLLSIEVELEMMRAEREHRDPEIITIDERYSTDISTLR